MINEEASKNTQYRVEVTWEDECDCCGRWGEQSDWAYFSANSLEEAEQAAREWAEQEHGAEDVQIVQSGIDHD